MDNINKDENVNVRESPNVDDALAIANIYDKLPREQKLIMYGQAIALATMNDAQGETA